MSQIIGIRPAPAFLAFLFLALAGCGGAAGTSSTTGSTPGTPQEPALPQPTYSGVRTQAVINTATAFDRAQGVLVALQFLASNRSSSLGALSSGDYNKTLNGDINGSVTLAGTIGADRTGWVEETFNDFEASSSPGIVVNGAFTFHQRQVASGVSFVGTLGFSHYTERSNGVTYEFNGTIDDGTDEIGNLSIAIGSDQVLISDVDLAQDASGYAISGRIYDSAAGYVDLSTVAPVTLYGVNYQIGITDIFPSGTSGDLTASGASGAAVHIQPLDDYFAFLGVDVDGDGTVDLGMRIDRSTDQPDAIRPAGTEVAALAQQSSGAPGTGPTTIDGRYSYTLGDFVSYSWQLLAAPLGSAVQVTGTGPTVQFTPDVFGDYLLQLTATSGGKSATDVTVVTYAANSNSSSQQSQYKTVGYIHATTGEQVTIDARASSGLGPAHFNSTIWTLHAPAGSSATIADRTAAVTEFTPDMPGIYYVTAGPGQPGDFGFTTGGTTVIGVDEPIRFAPPVSLSADTNLVGFGAGRFGGTGYGIALQTGSVFSSTPGIKWWRPMSDGLFGPGGSIQLAAGDLPDLLLMDLNGDGISDFITSTSSSVSDCPMDFRESSLGGPLLSYALSSVNLDSSCTLNSANPNMVRSATIGGHPAVAVLDSSYGSAGGSSIATFIADVSGNMQTPVVTPVKNADVFADDGLVGDFVLQDVTGDGEPDLIVSVSFISGGTAHSVVQVYKGLGDGNFTYLASYTPSGNSSFGQKLLIADLNGDGKPDIAVAFGGTLNIFYNDAAGDGTFSATPDTRSLDCVPKYMAMMDINGDGHPDLIAAPTGCSSLGSYDSLRFYLSTGSGSSTTLGQEQFYPILVGGNFGLAASVSDAAVQDFDGDGLQDLMLFNGNLLYMPQLPAITSATLSMSRRTEGVTLPRAIKPATSRGWARHLAVPPTHPWHR